MTHTLSVWMQRYLAAAWLLLFASIGAFGILALDRTPPYTLIRSEPVEGRAGDYIRIVSSVWRDKTRDCKVDYYRFMVDSSGKQFDLGRFHMSDATVDKLEARNPGRGDVVVRIPPLMEPGPATMRTVLLYQCNIAHALWPIEITVERPFTVLP